MNHGFSPSLSQPATGLDNWLATPQGRYALGWELRQFDNAVEDVFGYNAVQIGLPATDFLRESRIALRALVAGTEVPPDAQDPRGRVNAEPWALPFATHSIDLVVLPHVLEFSPHPHQILREVDRVLVPEGSVVISGLNPLSLWGLRRALGPGRHEPPWSARFIGLLRLKDWLSLLGFELNGGRFGCYAPPFNQAKWLERCNFMEKAGDRWWPVLGSVYVVRAIKRTVGMRMIGPLRRERRVPVQALAPAARIAARSHLRLIHPDRHDEHVA